MMPKSAKRFSDDIMLKTTVIERTSTEAGIGASALDPMEL
jgi:hypothetical protein